MNNSASDSSADSSLLTPHSSPPSAARAWLVLVGHSFQRHWRVRQMGWVAVGLLALVVAWVSIVTARGAWGLDNRRAGRGLPTFPVYGNKILPNLMRADAAVSPASYGVPALLMAAPQALLQVAALWRQDQDDAKAISAFEQAIHLKHDFAEAHGGLGNVLFRQGKLDKAIAAYRAVILHRHNDATARHNLGIALERQGVTLARQRKRVRALSRSGTEPDRGCAMARQGTQ